YINAGSTQTVSYEGRDFVGDMSFNPVYYNASRPDYVDAASSIDMFKSARSSSTYSSGNITYNLPVPNGIYKVSTYHVEQYYGNLVPGKIGQRIFDINIEGEEVKTSVDLFKDFANEVAKFEFSNI